MKNDELAKKLVDAIIEFRNCKIHKHMHTHMNEFTHSQKMVMFILHDLSKDGIVSLSDLRNSIKLAPSTLTPIITSLENDGYIVRNIDKEDRRNIYLHLSQKGVEYTRKINSDIENIAKDYIDFIGEEDSEQLIKIILKSMDFFKERRKNNEKNI